MKIQISKKMKVWLDEVGVTKIRCESIQGAKAQGIPVMAHVQKGRDVIFGVNARGVDVSLRGWPEIESLN